MIDHSTPSLTKLDIRRKSDALLIEGGLAIFACGTGCFSKTSPLLSAFELVAEEDDSFCVADGEKYEDEMMKLVIGTQNIVIAFLSVT